MYSERIINLNCSNLCGANALSNQSNFEFERPKFKDPIVLSKEMEMRGLIFIVGILFSVESFGVAFCALRDPIQQINALFPGYSDYESEVKSINASTANAFLAQRNVPVTLHAKEIGKHTLFYVRDAVDLIGMVHVRSEPGNWGLVEIAWSLTIDGKIKDYRFQRCRGGFCSDAESEDFRARFRGLAIDDLPQLFDPDGDIKPVDLQSGQQLWETMVRSAVKTLVLTEAFWLKDRAL